MRIRPIDDGNDSCSAKMLNLYVLVVIVESRRVQTYTTIEPIRLHTQFRRLNRFRSEGVTPRTSGVEPTALKPSVFRNVTEDFIRKPMVNAHPVGKLTEASAAIGSDAGRQVDSRADNEYIGGSVLALAFLGGVSNAQRQVSVAQYFVCGLRVACQRLSCYRIADVDVHTRIVEQKGCRIVRASGREAVEPGNPIETPAVPGAYLQLLAELLVALHNKQGLRRLRSIVIVE